MIAGFFMAQKKEISSIPPTAPRRTYSRSYSTEVMGTKENEQGISKRPPPVPRTSLIKSASISHGDQAMRNNDSLLNKHSSTGTISLSRSFSFESGGVRRKIPFTPAISTGPRRHDTVHYRHGTLVFPANTQDPATLLEDKTEKVPECNEKVKQIDETDMSILQLAINADVAGLIQFMDKHKKIPQQVINKADKSGKTALIHASATGNVSILRELLKLPGIDVNLADNEGNTALHLAAQAGHADVISLLTLSPTLLIDRRNMNGITPLMKAALQGRVRCTRLLLLAGSSPHLRDFGRGMCALEWARYCGRSKSAEIIEKYVDKMQLNPGLSFSSYGQGSRSSSEPNLKRSSFPFSSHSTKTKESWVKVTLKKAMQAVSGTNGNGSRNFNVASQLTNAVICASMPILPNESRRGPVPLKRASISDDVPTYIIPKIQITFWNTNPGTIPPPPPYTPPRPLDVQRSDIAEKEFKPQAPSRSRSVRSRSQTSPMPSRGELNRVLKQMKINDH